MSYQDRLLRAITLTSPDGTEFTAKWRSSTDPETKTQAQFKTVGGNRGRVQDLGLGLRTHNFTVYFEGDDNDIDSESFISALSQTGAWTIQHPVLGTLENQYPISFSPSVDPIESGNITAVETSWVTDYPEDRTESALQKATGIQSSVLAMNAKSVKNFFDRVKTTSANLNAKIKNVSDSVISAIDDNFSDLLSVVDGANATITTIENGITATIGSIEGNTESLAAEIQELCQKPAELLSSVKNIFDTTSSTFSTGQNNLSDTTLKNISSEKITAYKNVINTIISTSLSGSTEEKRNEAQTIQMSAVAAVGGIALAVIGADNIQTRSQAVDLSSSIAEQFNSVVNILDGYSDEINESVVSGLVTEKYFSQTETYDDMRILLSSVLQYLAQITLSLKKERTIKVKEPMSAIFVCLDYYDSADDDYVNLLIDSNNLSSDEIMLLPAGKELKIYV